MKRLGLFILLSVWTYCIAALIISGHQDGAGVFTIGGIFGFIILAAWLA